MKRNPLLVLSTLLSFAFICSSPVAAKDLYVSAWGGLNYIYDEDATSTAGTSTINYDLGGAAGIAVGIAVNDLISFEGEIGYRRNTVDFISNGNPGSGDTDVISGMANTVLNLGTFVDGTIKPYAGVGFGMANVESHFVWPNPNQDANEEVFAYQVMFGVDYKITADTNVFLETRYFQTADFDLDVSTGGTRTFKVRSTSGLIGIRHSF
jgi:opacity protein-like surface antigen